MIKTPFELYLADTLADPGAVMIEFMDAVVANSTVTAPGRPENLANSTVFESNLQPINLHTLPSSAAVFHTGLLIPWDDSGIHCADQYHIPQNLHSKTHVGQTSSSPLLLGDHILLMEHQFEILTANVRIKAKVIMRVE